MSKRIMKHTITSAILFLSLIFISGCDEGIDDWNSSARVIGNVFTDPAHTAGLQGVQVIIEGDPNGDTPYTGPDRWTTTDANGHFEGAVFLGNKGVDNQGNTNYVWIGDLTVSYFWNNKVFSWNGGITVAPGSDFTLPSVDSTLFQ